MPEEDGNGWDEYRRLVMDKLGSLERQLATLSTDASTRQSGIREEIGALRKELHEHNISQDKEIVGLRMKMLVLGMVSGLGGSGLGMGLSKLIEKFTS